MNSKVLNTLEYNKIKEAIYGYLSTSTGRHELSQLNPSSDPQQIERALLETDDGAHILRLQKSMPLVTLNDIRPYMKRLTINASLNGTELAQIMQVLITVNRMVSFFDNLRANKVELQKLYDLITTFAIIPEITQRLQHSLNPDGRLLDSASEELYGLRKRITRTETTIRNRMGKYLRGNQAKFLSEAIITIRDDRYVIPVKAEAKGKFGGIVHDQSASGQTLYIEPAAVVELNNQLRRDQLAARHEEIKILAELSAMVAPYQDEIITNAKIIGHLDLINAKAQYAKKIKATLPKLSRANHLHLKNARHPLIDPHKVVGNTITLGAEYRAIVVTGPNTGGKTITIKTVGLLQLMAQSGLFIPVNEGSQVGVFDDIFADIGDAQSIENNLSTFSSHMDNIIRILKRITANSLVLLDEVGAGTDPKEGAALAIAILDKIGSVDSEVIATTHYPELKAYAYNRPKTINASMEFDIDTLKPTYHLLVGVPGQSNGLNIAERLGMEASVIQEARSFSDTSSQEINNMIKQLADQTRRAREDADYLRSQLNAATKLHAELTEKFSQYEKQRERLTQNAKERANEIVAKSKRRADKIIADLHEKQKHLSESAVKENELMDAKGQLNALHKDLNLSNNRVLKREKAKHDFHKGDDVMVKSYGQPGVLVDKVGKQSWEVQIGILRMKIEESDLEKLNQPKQAPKRQYSAVRRTSSSGMSSTLDLRGHRYDEAMHEVDRYIDAALLAGYPSVTIIHGKGTGALRKGVTDYLKRNRRVKSFGYSPANAGGDGATVVKFK
ncbi:endonuclease MutS2 [Nicoliella spurrieriana]|uniref:Endonuclease MutS2 n=1 Tax=Nicoliella spurrieriana TaxID=2925830 RepID=A0A976RS48_9LACO|nr:endonuclease MutS2 [Nicoliella spurrieriana]UQS86784.1 endonuclease MutS2 [Nicoliella spurrieriana]